MRMRNLLSTRMRGAARPANRFGTNGPAPGTKRLLSVDHQSTISRSRDFLRRAQGQRDERQRPVRAAAGWRRRRTDDEQVLVVVRAAEAVAHARRRVLAHAAAAAG